MAQHNDYGRWGEQQAAEYLQRKGYSICHRNWRIGHRDLDITALTPDGETLVVVEVKTRRNADFSSPEEAVDWRKIHHLTRTAQAYVQRYQVSCGVRFDIISVTGTGDNVRINHVENAFIPPMR